MNTSTSPTAADREASTPTPWHIGMRGGQNASGIYAYDGEQTHPGENAKYFDTHICSVSAISLHRSVEEVESSERDAVGLANARLIVRCVNENARLTADNAALVDTLQWAQTCFHGLVYAENSEERAYYYKDAEHALERITAALAAAKA